MPNFGEFVANGQLPPVAPASSDSRLNQPAVNTLAPNGMGREIIIDYLNNTFPAWQALGHTESPIRMMWNIIGSRAQEDTLNMVNAEDTLNLIKAKIWGLSRVIGVGRWRAVTDDISQNSGLAVTLFHYVSLPLFRAKLVSSTRTHTYQTRLSGSSSTSTTTTSDSGCAGRTSAWSRSCRTPTWPTWTKSRPTQELVRPIRSSISNGETT